MGSLKQLFGGRGGGVSNPAVSADKTTASGTGVKPNSTVTVYKNGASVGTATADGSGAWSYSFGAALPNGSVITYDAILASPSYTVPGPISASWAEPLSILDFDFVNQRYWSNAAGAAITFADGFAVDRVGGTTPRFDATGLLFDHDTFYDHISAAGALLTAISGTDFALMVETTAGWTGTIAAYGSNQVALIPDGDTNITGYPNGGWLSTPIGGGKTFSGSDVRSLYVQTSGGGSSALAGGGSPGTTAQILPAPHTPFYFGWDNQNAVAAGSLRRIMVLPETLTLAQQQSITAGSTAPAS